jgi:hypothetical protein
MPYAVPRHSRAASDNGDVGLVATGGLQGARYAIRAMRAARVAAALQEFKNLMEQRKQDEIERAARSREGIDLGRLGLDTDKFGFDQTKWGDEAPTRAADVAYKGAQTAATTQKTDFERQNREGFLQNVDLLPREVPGQVSPRTLANLQYFGDVNMLTPSGRQALYSPEQLGAQEGGAEASAWKSGGRAVEQGKSDIREGAEGRLLGQRVKLAQATAGEKPSTGAQQQILAYYNRAKSAEENIAPMEDEIAKMGLIAQGRMQYAPNWAQSSTGQQYRQAQRAFTEARLRKESGAAIPQSEYDNDARTYFAVPGDTADTLAQKRAARAEVLDGLAFGAGKAYDEFYGTSFQRGQHATKKAPGTGPAPGTQRIDPQGRTIEWDGKGWFVR